MRQLLLLFVLLVPASALAIGPRWPLSDSPRFWILGEGLSHYSFDSHYFESRANYDDNGLPASPSNFTTQYLDARLNAGFGFASKLSFFAQTDFRAVQMSNTDINSSSALTNGDNQGFGDAFLGFRGLIWRTNPTDRVYPTEWSPDSWVWIFEGTWKFPLYDHNTPGQMPLGDQSNDFSGIYRLAWYANEWLALSASTGFIYRTAGYDNLIPWSLRADFSLQERLRLRIWTSLQSFERMRKSSFVLNPEQPDPMPNGGLLFKSYAPVIRTATLGAGYLLSKEWEVVAGSNLTASGRNFAKGWGLEVGITWRPYQVPEIKYEEFRRQQIQRLQTEDAEKHRYRNKVVKYGFRATIVKVSDQGNYVKILYGEKDRVRPGDTFYIMPPDTLSTLARRPVAFATVEQAQPDAAYLHIDERYVDGLEIREGFEVRRVYFEWDE